MCYTYICGMNHIQLRFSIADQNTKETLTALLSNLEISGTEETEETLIVYMEENHYQEQQQEIQDIATQLQLTFSVATMAQRNWNEEWEQNFQPVVIEDFCSVRADFHPKPEQVAYDIVITPKMSFGTGHHSTTALMMGRMRNLDFRNKTVFDFGTGTGILAILAEMLGAASILAIDNDEWSFENAQENCTRNSTQNITVQQTTIETVPGTPKFDIILANINRHILLAYMSQMSALLQDGGYLLLSGILLEDVPMIRDAATQEGLAYDLEQTDKGWVCMQFVKGQNK